MTDRLLILLLIFGGIAAGSWAVRYWTRRQQQRAMETLELPVEPDGSARIVSFYGPSCDACDRQKQVLAELQTERPTDLTVDLRDATVDYDYARQFGLVIVPTTVVIRSDGGIAGINSGFTAPEVLRAQLDAA